MIVEYSPIAIDSANFFLLFAAAQSIRYAIHLKLFHRIIIGNCQLKGAGCIKNQCKSSPVSCNLLLAWNSL